MSLINDALKKAQRERSSGAPQPPFTAASTSASANPVARTAARPATNLWPIAIAAVALVGGGAAVWFLKPATPAPVTVAASVQPVAPSVTETPARVGPAPAPSATVAADPTRPLPAVAEQPAPQLHINLPGLPPATAPAQAAAQPSSASAPAAIATPPPVAPAAAPAASAPFQVTLQLEDPRVLAFLDNARISGIRIAADDAKLLMNGKVFRTGDVVDRELGLKIVTIRPAELVFEDKRGIQYRKLL